MAQVTQEEIQTAFAKYAPVFNRSGAQGGMQGYIDEGLSKFRYYDPLQVEVHNKAVDDQRNAVSASKSLQQYSSQIQDVYDEVVNASKEYTQKGSARGYQSSILSAQNKLRKILSGISDNQRVLEDTGYISDDVRKYIAQVQQAVQELDSSIGESYKILQDEADFESKPKALQLLETAWKGIKSGLSRAGTGTWEFLVGDSSGIALAQKQQRDLLDFIAKSEHKDGSFRGTGASRSFGKTPREKILDIVHKGDEAYQAELQQLVSFADNKMLAEAISSLGYSLGYMIPTMVTAGLTGGVEAPASVLSGAPFSSGTALSAVAQSTVANPSFWATAIPMYGNTYYEAKQEGATETEAQIAGLLNGFLGGVIETSGGIGALPTDKTGVLVGIIRDALAEGGEEVAQGIVENAVASAIYRAETPTFSMDNVQAVINPVRALKEFALGTVAGGLFGSAKAGIGAVASKAASGIQSRRAGTVTPLVNTAIQGVTEPESAYLAQGATQAQSVPRATGAVDIDGVQAYMGGDVLERRSYSLPQSEWEAAQRNVNSSVSEVRSLGDIVNAIRKAFNIPISTGRIRKRGAAGIFKSKSKAVRTQVSNAVPVIAHEVGHYIDSKYGVSSSQHIQEVIDYVKKEKPEFLDGYKPNEHNSEAFAEFMRVFLSDKQTAKQNMPNFYNDFVNTVIGKNGTADMAHLEAIGDMINAYMTGSKRQRALSAITTRNEALKTAKSQQSLHEKYVQFRFNHDDILFPLKDVSEETYNIAVESLKANARVEQNISGEFMSDIDGNPVYKKDADGNITNEVMPSLAVIQRNIPSSDSNNFTLYLVYKRALSWLEKGRRVFADDTLNDPAFISQEIADLEAGNPNFADTAQQLYDWQKRFMEVWLVDRGIISREMFNKLWAVDPNYVPFDRDVIGRPSAKKKGFSSSVPIYRAKGSGLSIYNPIESIILRVDKYIHLAEQNYIKQSLREAISTQDGLGFIAEIVPPTAVPNSVSTRDMKAEFESKLNELNLAEGDADAVIDALDAVVGDDLTEWIVKGNQGEDILISLEDGERVYTQIHDKNLYNTFSALGGKQTRSLLDFFGKLTRVMKTLTTGINLYWALMSNVPSDFLTGFKYTPSTNNIFKYTADYLKSIAGIIKTETAGIRRAGPEIGGYSQYKAAGGGYSSRISNPKTLRTLMQDVIEHDKSGFRKMLTNRVRLLEGIEKIADIFEQSTRYPEYLRALDSGMTPRQAVRMADEVTVNFSKWGAWSKQIDKIVPYYNPGVQGLSRMGRALQEDTAPFLIKSFASATILSALVTAWNYLFMDDGEEYEKLDTYAKNSYYCFSNGKGEFIKIRKDRELAVLESLFERTLEHEVGQNNLAFVDFANYIFEQFAPPGIPTPTEGVYPMVQDMVLIGTLAETMANRDYKGSPIVPAQYQDLLPEAQYDERTSLIAKELGRALGWSPMKIDHFLTSNFGVLGKITKAVTAEDKDPLLGFGHQIIADPAYSQVGTRVFYDDYKIKASTAKTYPDNGEYQAEYKAWNSVRSVLSEINKMARDPDNDERVYKILARDYAIDFLENQPDIDDRLVKLYERTKESSVFYNREFNNEFKVDGKKVSLDINDFIQYVDDYNETAERLYDSVLSASGFSGLTDSQKVKVLGRIKDDVSESMKRKYVTKTESVGVVSAVEQGIPAETYLRVKLFASTDGNDSISQAEARAALDKTNLTQQQKSIMWTLINKGWKNNPYGSTSSTNWMNVWGAS